MKAKNLLKKAFLLLALVGGTTSAWADTEWIMANWSTGHTGLTYWASGSSADIPTTSTDKNVPAWADESTYDTYTGTGGSSSFQLDGKTSTWKSGNPNRVWSFDVAANDVIKVYFMGGGSGNRSMYVSYNATTTNRDTETAFGSATADGYTPTILSATATTAGTVYLWCDQNVRVYAIKVISGATTAPTITTDLSATADVTVGVAQVFSIEATGATSYQWYVGGEAVVGATSASYSYTAGAAGNVEIYCNAINAVGPTKSTVCTVTATMPASAPTITTDLEAAYNVQKGKTQVLTIVADGASSYQWYKDGEAIGGATSTSYTYTAGSTIGATNDIYCKATNAAGSVNSTTATMTVVGSNACELINIKFSNGAWGAINNYQYGDNTIAVPYMEGTTAPTVVESSIVISDGATYAIDGDKLTVTAEDETTKKVFTITKVAVTPLSVSANIAVTNFTEVPSWVFNLYGYDAKKGVKFAKAVDQEDNMRIAVGNTRQYYFIGAAKSLTLTAVEKVDDKGAIRKVNVYVNGTKVITDTNNDALGAIALNESASNLVIIESNQTSGDGGFASYAIAASENVTATIGSTGWTTFSSPYALNLSSMTASAGDVAAYYASATSAESVTVLPTESSAVKAGEGILLKGTAGATITIPVVATGSEISGNLMVGCPTATNITSSTPNYETCYVLGIESEKAVFQNVKNYIDGGNTVNIPAGKAYLNATSSNGARALRLSFGGITEVENVVAAEATAKKNGAYLENGRIAIYKNGMKFNANGQLIK